MNKVKIIAIGGAGGNTLLRFKKPNFSFLETIAINTDLQDLKKTRADKKIQIGLNLTNGLGTGMNPEIGEKSAIESKEIIAKSLEYSDLVFIIGGAGGGTFSGAAPVIAEIAKKKKAIVVSIFTMPFSFEGEKRKKIAKDFLLKIKNKVDSFIQISNNKLLKSKKDKNLSLEKLFFLGDKALYDVISVIIELLKKQTLLSIDYSSLKKILKSGGKTFVFSKNFSLKNNLEELSKTILTDNIIFYSPKGAKRILLYIKGKNLTIGKIREISLEVLKKINKKAKLIFGAREDRTMREDKIKLFLIASKIP